MHILWKAGRAVLLYSLLPYGISGLFPSAACAEASFSEAGLAASPVSPSPVSSKTAEENWFSDITFGLQVEGGIMANSSSPANKMNYGQLLAYQSNQPLLNQLALTVTKPVDPIGGGYGLGVNLQMIYGSDARVYTITGISDRWMNRRYQLTPTIANIALHMPWLTKGGLDGQIGILPSPMGVEVLDPAARAFYTMSYTAQYSNPFEHVGAMFQLHVTDHYAALFGVDAGNQTSFGRGNNNGRPAGYVGFSGSDLANGALSFTYLFRVGPEDARRVLGTHRAHTAQRYWNDLNATWQITSKWSVTGELNQVHDEGLHANSWGAVAWGAYHATNNLTFNARAEIYRDSKGAFVTSYAADEGYAKGLLGLPTDSYSAGPTTYSDLSLNAVWRPELGHHVKTLQFRPEIRFDRALNKSRPFDDFSHKGRILVGGDMTLGF